MTDITICTDSNCPVFETCYRAQAKRDGRWQSYFSGGKRTDVSGCELYIPVVPNAQRQETNEGSEP